MIQKSVSKEEAGKNLKVFYLKDGRRRHLDLQHLFRAGLLLMFLDRGFIRNRSWSRSNCRSMGSSRT